MQSNPSRLSPSLRALPLVLVFTISACQAKDNSTPAPSLIPANLPGTEQVVELQDGSAERKNLCRDNPKNFCRGGLFADCEEFRLAKVVGAENARAYFYTDDSDDCPNASLAKCRLNRYLIPGDQIIVSKTYNDFVCSWFWPAKGSETVDWLSLGSLAIIKTDSNPLAEKWVGTWRSGDSSVTVKNETMGSLRMRGESSWTGITGSVHIGNFNGSTRPQGNQATLEDGICKLKLILIGDYLIANDNSLCGGANVSFDGVYRRKK